MYKRPDTSTEAFYTTHLKSSGGATSCCHLLVGYRLQMLLMHRFTYIKQMLNKTSGVIPWVSYLPCAIHIFYISSCDNTFERTHKLCFKGFPENSPFVFTSRLTDSYLVCPSSDSRSGSRKGKTFDVFDGIRFFFFSAFLFFKLGRVDWASILSGSTDLPHASLSHSWLSQPRAPTVGCWSALLEQDQSALLKGTLAAFG